MDVAKAVIFKPGSSVEDIHNQLYLALLVNGERGERIDVIGLAWDLPSSTHDEPGGSELWEEILKLVVLNSKPRHAIRDATLAMETGLLVRSELQPWALELL